ncbi:Protein of unknown function [Gryllus bimaculatus]|nr:Protein of unknown function [Gryllus bimaculatus]
MFCTGALLPCILFCVTDISAPPCRHLDYLPRAHCLSAWGVAATDEAPLTGCAHCSVCAGGAPVGAVSGAVSARGGGVAGGWGLPTGSSAHRLVCHRLVCPPARSPRLVCHRLVMPTGLVCPPASSATGSSGPPGSSAHRLVCPTGSSAPPASVCPPARLPPGLVCPPGSSAPRLSAPCSSAPGRSAHRSSPPARLPPGSSATGSSLPTGSSAHRPSSAPRLVCPTGSSAHRSVCHRLCLPTGSAAPPASVCPPARLPTGSSATGLVCPTGSSASGSSAQRARGGAGRDAARQQEQRVFGVVRARGGVAEGAGGGGDDGGNGGGGVEGDPPGRVRRQVTLGAVTPRVVFLHVRRRGPASAAAAPDSEDALSIIHTLHAIGCERCCRWWLRRRRAAATARVSVCMLQVYYTRCSQSRATLAIRAGVTATAAAVGMSLLPAFAWAWSQGSYTRCNRLHATAVLSLSVYRGLSISEEHYCFQQLTQAASDSVWRSC